MFGLGATELLILLCVSLIPMVLAIAVAARKGLEPLWLWVVLAVLFPLVILIVTLVMPRRDATRA